MQSINTILLAFMMIHNEGAADGASGFATRDAEREQRILLAQTQQGRVEAKTSQDDSRRGPTDEEKLALAAMEGLMSQPAERALPIIKRVLTGPQTTLVKRRALFVLSQINSPEAQEILLETSRSANKDLQKEAIRSIGISGNAKSLAALQDIYKSGDQDAKRQVLQAWLIAGRKEEVYQAAINATSESEANEAIRLLSTMGAVDELRKLGDRGNAGRGLMEAYAISGDLSSLRKIAEGNDDVSMRSEAVRKIGIIGSDAAKNALREIYTATREEKVKNAALQGMLISGDDDGVLALYRAANSADERQTLLRTLSMMGGEAALQAIDATLEGND